jgi:hypothetical protein
MRLTRLVWGAAAAALLALAPAAPAQIVEGFDDVSLLPGLGWFIQNNSTPPTGTSVFQGNPAVFAAHSGAANSYAGMNFQASTGTAGTETLSVWLLTPEIPLDNGTTISFFTRTVTANPFPDRLQVRLSTAGASTNVGTAPADVGDFTNLLVDINPTYATGGVYPETFTEFPLTISGLPGPTTGRVAFRYFVENGGPNGANSNFIGIDTLSITPVPEPTSLALAGLAGAVGLVWRRRKAAAA